MKRRFEENKKDIHPRGPFRIEEDLWPKVPPLPKITAYVPPDKRTLWGIVDEVYGDGRVDVRLMTDEEKAHVDSSKWEIAKSIEIKMGNESYYVTGILTRPWLIFYEPFKAHFGPITFSTYERRRFISSYAWIEKPTVKIKGELDRRLFEEDMDYETEVRKLHTVYQLELKELMINHSKNIEKIRKEFS